MHKEFKKISKAFLSLCFTTSWSNLVFLSLSENSDVGGFDKSKDSFKLVFVKNLSQVQCIPIYWIIWVKEWRQVSHFISLAGTSSFLSLIQAFVISFLNILNIKVNSLVKYMHGICRYLWGVTAVVNKLSPLFNLSSMHYMMCYSI